jgi:hypothetical protein
MPRPPAGFPVRVVQSKHDDPQCLSSGATQSVPQRTRPFWHEEYTRSQLPAPSHVRVAPVAVGQTVQALPQLPGQVELLAMHVPTLAHQWYPELQVTAQVPLWHTGLPWRSPAHDEHWSPQWLTSEFRKQLFPQRWAFELQTKPQLDPSHVAWPFVGMRQGVQEEAPQASVLLFDMQVPLHRWEPDGQDWTQLVPLHVTDPPAGAWQTVQLLPQEFLSVLPLTTQVVPQAW